MTLPAAGMNGSRSVSDGSEATCPPLGMTTDAGMSGMGSESVPLIIESTSSRIQVSAVTSSSSDSGERRRYFAKPLPNMATLGLTLPSRSMVSANRFASGLEWCEEWLRSAAGD